jgi:hypothetical protein
MEDVGKFYGHFVYFTAIWYTLWPFGIICGHFGIHFPFWCVAPRKIWQPCIQHQSHVSCEQTLSDSQWGRTRQMRF